MLGPNRFVSANHWSLKMCLNVYRKNSRCCQILQQQKVLQHRFASSCCPARHKMAFTNRFTASTDFAAQVQYSLRFKQKKVIPALDEAPFKNEFLIRQSQLVGGRHSSVESSAPAIPRPRVQIPSTTSTLISIQVYLYFK